MRDLIFLAPRALWLLGALPLVWLAAAGSLTDLARPQRIISGTIRTILCATLVLALARPAWIESDRRVAMVLAIDVSDSVTDGQLAEARALATRTLAARGSGDLRLITFAEHATPVDLSRDATEIPPLTRHVGHGGATNLAAAVRLAYALLPADHVRRIVLVSDGHETAGDLAAEAERARRAGVRIHVWPLSPSEVRDVAIARLELPDLIKVGAPFDLRAELYATHETDATLLLTQAGFPNPLEPRKRVHLGAGRTEVRFRSQVNRPGAVPYRLAIAEAAGGTGRPENDAASATLEVRGKPRVLYVEGERGAASYLRGALSRENIDVDVRGPEGVPRSARELDGYDLLLLSDVAQTFVGPDAMAAIETYVRDLGGGFVMVGGEASFGSGGYTGTRLEKLLPVRLETEKRRDEPGLGLVLVIDRSGSMSGEKIELAKEAAKATAELLAPQDLIGVIAFDSQPTTTVRLQRASNRLRILSDISKLQAGGGTQILPALQEAFAQLGPARAKVKHVILLTDGQSAYDGIPELLDEMTAAKITVTGVGIGSGADRTLLTMIAERGGGRFYFTQDPQSIPKIFTKETTQVARSALVEDLVSAHVARRAQVLEGIDLEHAPPLRGYVSTKPKPLSEVLLVSDQGEPILARWRAGLGQVVAFTSDVKNRWAVDWLRWPGYAKFWAQLVRSTMRHRAEESFALATTSERGQVHVTLDAQARSERFATDLDCSAELYDPAHPTNGQAVPLAQTAPGRYEGELTVQEPGGYVLRALARQRGELVGERIASVSVPYPPEYLAVGIDEARLARAARQAGGAVRPTAAAIFDPGTDSVRTPHERWQALLGLALAIIVIDVAARRIRLFGYR